MLTPLIYLLLLLSAGHMTADEPPSVRVLSYAEGAAKISVSNPTTSSIYFQAPPGQNPDSVEVLEGLTWVPLSHSWCGAGFGFVELPAGGVKTYEVQVGRWVPHGKKFRFHVWYFTDTDYKKFMQDSSDEGLRALHCYRFQADPTDA